jgi:hypothetical protein
MPAAESVADAPRLAGLLEKAAKNRDFEAVIAVTSIHDMNMGTGGTLVNALDSREIWDSNGQKGSVTGP